MVYDNVLSGHPTRCRHGFAAPFIVTAPFILLPLLERFLTVVELMVAVP